jgi:hypothetical protein
MSQKTEVFIITTVINLNPCRIEYICEYNTQSLRYFSSFFFPSALQLRVSFGLLNNQPPFLSLVQMMKRRMVE